MPLTFYAVPMSTYCAKVRIILHLKSVDFVEQLPSGGSYRADAYRKLVAAGSVPAIQFGAFVLHDSDAISEYLEDCYPEPAMRAADLQQRAYHRSVARYHDTRLEPALRALFSYVGGPPQGKADVSLSALQECLARLDKLIDPAPYLWADRLCLADCAYPTTLFMVEDIFSALGSNIELPAKVRAWQAALYDNIVIRRVVDDNRVAVAAWLESKERSR